jgi:protein-tyrosine-phosphatase
VLLGADIFLVIFFIVSLRKLVLNLLNIAEKLNSLEYDIKEIKQQLEKTSDFISVLTKSQIKVLQNLSQKQENKGVFKNDDIEKLRELLKVS